MLPQAGERPLGIVMLDTRFPRLPGDVGHPWTFPGAIHRTVHGAVPREVVTSAAALRASPLRAAFIAAMQALEREGVGAITTSCGFLVLLQQELQDAVGVPVVASSLLLLPRLLERDRRVGVLTISEASLTREYFEAAGVPDGRMADVVVQGVEPHGEFASAILGNRATMDAAAAAREVVDAALRLRSRAPDVRAVVLECTNLPPHAQAVRRATGLEIHWLKDALARYF